MPLLTPFFASATAVASGAVLRAINKEQGPRRIARSSYGILRTEPHGQYPEHRGVRKWRDPHDGQAYVRRTIDWVLKLVSSPFAVRFDEPLFEPGGRGLIAHYL